MNDLPFPDVMTPCGETGTRPFPMGVQILANNDTDIDDIDGIHEWVTIQMWVLYSGVPRALCGVWLGHRADYRFAAGTTAESHDHDRAIFSTRSISSPDTSPFHTLSTVSSSSMQRRIASVPWSATNDR